MSSNMPKKLVVLDKDGTLVVPKSGAVFVQEPTDQVLMDGVVRECQKLIKAGYTLSIASNQGGIAAGHKTLDDTVAEMQYCLFLLKEHHIDIDKAMFCPDFNGNKCYEVICPTFSSPDTMYTLHLKKTATPSYRKPKPGMLFLAVGGTLGLTSGPLTNCWMIGDREEDLLAAESIGFNFLDADRWRQGGFTISE